MCAYIVGDANRVPQPSMPQKKGYIHAGYIQHHPNERVRPANLFFSLIAFPIQNPCCVANPHIQSCHPIPSPIHIQRSKFMPISCFAPQPRWVLNHVANRMCRFCPRASLVGLCVPAIKRDPSGPIHPLLSQFRAEQTQVHRQLQSQQEGIASLPEPGETPLLPLPRRRRGSTFYPSSCTPAQSRKAPLARTGR